MTQKYFEVTQNLFLNPLVNLECRHLLEYICFLNSSGTPPKKKIFKCQTYAVVNNGLKGMLDFLAHTVALQDVNDAQVKQKSLALVISGWYTTRPVNRLTVKQGFYRIIKSLR